MWIMLRYSLRCNKIFIIERDVSMIAEERYKIILSTLEDKEIVKVQDLANRFNISLETVRRDLDKLEKDKLIKRVHGGAIKVNQKVGISSFQDRRTEFSDQKKEVAEFVYSLLPNNQIIFMDSSTTNYEIALLYKKGIKTGLIITNSLMISMELSTCDHITTRMLGGTVNGQELATFGVSTISNLENNFANYSLISTSGIMENIGITDHNIDLGQVQRKMIENSETSIIIADSTKFDVISNYKIANFEDISLIVTDSRIKSSILNRYSQIVNIASK